MAYCGPKGIPYEEWMGLAVGWTLFSRMAAIAWQAREADRCGSCGQVHADWLGDDGREARDPPCTVVRVKCLGCEALELDRADQGDKIPPYMHQRFQPVPASLPAPGGDGTVSG